MFILDCVNRTYIPTITTTSSTTNGTAPPHTKEPKSLVVVGAVMLSGMVFVNICVVGGWYALKKKNGDNDNDAPGGVVEAGLLDKQLHFKDIQMGERIGIKYIFVHLFSIVDKKK